MSKNTKIESVELTSKLISTFCHDLISPVSSIATGLELLNEEDDLDTRKQYLNMINASTQNASTKLQFIRLAFGSALSVDSNYKINDIQNLVICYLDEEKYELVWQVPDIEVPSKFIKLLLNLLLLSVQCNSAGGTLTVTMNGPPEFPNFKVISTSNNPNIPSDIDKIFGDEMHELANISLVQPYFCKLLAETYNVVLKIEKITNAISISMIHR